MTFRFFFFFTIFIFNLYQEENGNQKVSDLFVRVGRVTFMIIMLILSGFIVFGKEFLLIWVGDDDDHLFNGILTQMAKDTLSEHLRKRTMLWLKNCGSKWQSLSARKKKATSNTAFRRGYLSKRKHMSKWRREKKSSIPIVAVLILSTATLLP